LILIATSWSEDANQRLTDNFQFRKCQIDSGEMFLLLCEINDIGYGRAKSMHITRLYLVIVSQEIWKKLGRSKNTWRAKGQ